MHCVGCVHLISPLFNTVVYCMPYTSMKVQLYTLVHNYTSFLLLLLIFAFKIPALCSVCTFNFTILFNATCILYFAINLPALSFSVIYLSQK